MASAFVSSCLLGSASRLAPESPLRRDLRLVQPITCTVGVIRGGGLGIPPPHLGCLLFSRQCRRSSQLLLRSSPWCLSQSLCFPSIVATTTGVTSCSSSADCLLSGPLVLRECLRRDVVWWWFYSWWCLRFCLGQCFVAIATVVTSSSPSASVLRECLRRDVVWWWKFHSCWCLRFRLGQRESYDWKLLYLFPVPRGRWVCLHAECLVQQH